MTASYSREQLIALFRPGPLLPTEMRDIQSPAISLEAHLPVAFSERPNFGELMSSSSVSAGRGERERRPDWRSAGPPSGFSRSGVPSSGPSSFGGPGLSEGRNKERTSGSGMGRGFRSDRNPGSSTFFGSGQVSEPNSSMHGTNVPSGSVSSQHASRGAAANEASFPRDPTSAVNPEDRVWVYMLNGGGESDPATLTDLRNWINIGILDDSLTISHIDDEPRNWFSVRRLLNGGAAQQQLAQNAADSVSGDGYAGSSVAMGPSRALPSNQYGIGSTAVPFGHQYAFHGPMGYPSGPVAPHFQSSSMHQMSAPMGNSFGQPPMMSSVPWTHPTNFQSHHSAGPSLHNQVYMYGSYLQSGGPAVMPVPTMMPGAQGMQASSFHSPSASSNILDSPFAMSSVSGLPSVPPVFSSHGDASFFGPPPAQSQLVSIENDVHTDVGLLEEPEVADSQELPIVLASTESNLHANVQEVAAEPADAKRVVSSTSSIESTSAAKSKQVDRSEKKTQKKRREDSARSETAQTSESIVVIPKLPEKTTVPLNVHAPTVPQPVDLNEIMMEQQEAHRIQASKPAQPAKENSPVPKSWSVAPPPQPKSFAEIQAEEEQRMQGGSSALHQANPLKNMKAKTKSNVTSQIFSAPEEKAKSVWNSPVPAAGPHEVSIESSAVPAGENEDFWSSVESSTGANPEESVSSEFPSLVSAMRAPKPQLSFASLAQALSSTEKRPETKSDAKPLKSASIVTNSLTSTPPVPAMPLVSSKPASTSAVPVAPVPVPQPIPAALPVSSVSSAVSSSTSASSSHPVPKEARSSNKVVAGDLLQWIRIQYNKLYKVYGSQLPAFDEVSQMCEFVASSVEDAPSMADLIVDSLGISGQQIRTFASEFVDHVLMEREAVVVPVSSGVSSGVAGGEGSGLSKSARKRARRKVRGVHDGEDDD